MCHKYPECIVASEQHSHVVALCVLNNSTIHQSDGSLATSHSPYRRKNGHIPSMGEWPLGDVLSGGLPAARLVNSTVNAILFASNCVTEYYYMVAAVLVMEPLV